MKKVNLTSSNLSKEKLVELRRILPEAFSEEKIDWDKLKTVLGAEIDPRTEKFNFIWTGKNEAVKNVLIPSGATLRPAMDESIDFDKSENIFIEGDNLEALKLLQKTYFKSIKMIYIDPPYNTGGDFVYHDDFSSPLKNYLEQTEQIDSEGNKLRTNVETSGRYHSDWLSMMYPRLKLAWNLLREDGVIFVSIDDNEVHHLRMLMDEIFGEESFIAQLIWKSRQNKDNRNTTGASIDHEYVLCYGNRLRGDERKKEQYKNPDNDPRGPWVSGNMVGLLPEDQRPNCHYDLINSSTGINYGKPKLGWRYDKGTMGRLIEEKRIIFPENKNGRPRRKVFLSELKDEFTGFSSIIGKEIFTRNGTAEVNSIFGFPAMDFPKPSMLIRDLIMQGCEENGVVLDFFAGSGTTAQAVLELNEEDGGNRKFILVQLPEATKAESQAYREGFKTIADVAKERIRRVIKGYGDNPTPLDDGFKIFKLGKSNYIENNFDFDPKKSEEENATAFNIYLAKAKQNSLFDETMDISVVYENIIKEGLSLNSKISQFKLGKTDMYKINDGERELLISLDKKLDTGAVKELTSADYKNKTFICLDSALDDTAKANLGLHLELKTI
jgi:adenine-specific DNA-methyltransferase